MGKVDPRPGTKYVRFTVDVWYQESDDSIHVTSPDWDLHTTVNDKPESKRCHENLYKKLKRVLEEHGKVVGAVAGEES